MEEKILFWATLFDFFFWSTRVRCVNCSRLRMKTVERCQWRRSSVFIVNCEHISNVILIVEFEQANVCWVHFAGFKHFWRQDRVYHALCCRVWTKFINKEHLNLYLHNPTSKSVRNFCEGIYCRHWFWLKRCSSPSKWPTV